MNYILPTASSGDPNQAALAILDAPWVSFVLTTLTLSLLVGVILRMGGMVALAVRDSRPFAAVVVVSVILILLQFFPD